MPSSLNVLFKGIGVQEQNIASNMLSAIKKAMEINYKFQETDSVVLKEMVQDYFSSDQQQELLSNLLDKQEWKLINCIFDIVKTEIKNKIIKGINIEAVIEKTYGNELFVKIALHNEESAIKLLKFNISILSEAANIKAKLSLIGSVYHMLPITVKTAAENIVKENSKSFIEYYNKTSHGHQTQSNLLIIAEKLFINIPQIDSSQHKF